MGLWRARIVEMTGMPELIALLHSFVGLAAVLVGWNGYLHVEADPEAARPLLRASDLLGIHTAEVVHRGLHRCRHVHRIDRGVPQAVGPDQVQPADAAGQELLNLGALVAFGVLTVWFVLDPSCGCWWRSPRSRCGSGWHLVASIGGGDMPVVVSMLNSYSGWAAAASGFLLENDLLIITGALVGSSGAYLSYIMCRAMNRSFLSVIAGGFGIEAGPADDTDYGEHREITAEGVAELLAAADTVVITPGYGMAVAQAQYGVAELTRNLRERGVTCASASTPWPGGCPAT